MIEISPTLLVTVALAEIAFIAWLIRLESKTNANSEDIKELFRHVENPEIHHRADDLDRRFDMLITAITKIETSIDKLMERFDKFLMQK